MGNRRRKSLIQRSRRPGLDPEVVPSDQDARPEDGDTGDPEQDAPPDPEDVEPEPSEPDPAPETPEAPGPPEEPAALESDADQDAPPLPGGWPLEANLRPPNLPGTRGSAPMKPRPPPPPPVEVAPPAAIEPPPSPEPVFAAQRKMLKGHSRPPEAEPLVTHREWRVFAVLLTVALSAIACGSGGLVGLLTVLQGFLG